jgi:two-component system, OmpR family, sensor histidine kinase KdpD
MDAISTRRIVAVAVPVAAVVGLTVVLNLSQADLTVAALCFVPVVVGSALLGAFAGGISVLCAFLATNYFFTEPRHSFAIDKTQDLVALVAFAAAAAVVSVTVARVNLLRHRAVAQGREARTRLELMNRLAAGEDPWRVVSSAGDSIEELFGFVECRADLDASGRLVLHTVPSADALPSEERALLDAFVNDLAASLDRVRLAREARVARDAAAIEESRAAFLSAMTHNLRTPLASIGAAAAVMLERPMELDRPEQVELLETVRGEADRLDRLVTKVLLLGGIQAGTVNPAPEPLEIEELVQAAAKRMRLLGLGRVQMSGSPDLPSVLVDQMLIEVALVNVLENALRYSSPDSTVDIELARGADHVRVSVVDHGPGVPIADRERMFEQFVRGDEVNDSVGTGIGLAITREFVQAHGGRCWFEATPGGGATVVMTLPIVSA